jgi:two-component system sensor histidine kinase KdpD
MQIQHIPEFASLGQTGSLKIYLGYAAGVGKTYAMLQEAHRLKSRGFDVVIGEINCRDRSDTLDLVGNLEIIPSRFYTCQDRSFEELNLAAIISRKPQYVLLDDLAHQNAPGAKNDTRYQDVLEILKHKIHVITTMNIENLESRSYCDLLPTLPNLTATVPDFVFQKAEQIIHVDVAIDELRERVRLGKIFSNREVNQELSTSYSRPNLYLLREAALKESISHQYRKIQEDTELSSKVPYLEKDAVMVALSSDPSNAEVLIRKGTRLAARLSMPCFVVYIQKRSENTQVIDPELLNKLKQNMHLAKSLGAEVITICSENVAATLVEFSHENRVRHAVFGKSRLSPLRERMRGSIILSFLHDSVGVDVHIVSTAEGAERCL